MLYPLCPTCKTTLSDKIIGYQKELELLCNRTDLDLNTLNNEKKKLLDKYHIINMCCRMRVMGYVKLIDLVK